MSAKPARRPWPKVGDPCKACGLPLVDPGLTGYHDGDGQQRTCVKLLHEKIAMLEEIRAERNVPVKYITVGSVIHAVWGTSSIAYVDQLRSAAIALVVEPADAPKDESFVGIERGKVTALDHAIGKTT